MKFYRNAIILFGLVLPLLAAGAIIGVSYSLKSKMTASLDEKMSHYKSYEMTRQAALATEGEISRKRPHVERWKAQLSEEVASSLSTTLPLATAKLPPKEIEGPTAFDPRGSPGGFGAVTSQPSSHIRLGYRATYRTMQQAFLELETLLPQLQLQELRITPNPGTGSLHNFQVSYTAWQN